MPYGVATPTIGMNAGVAFQYVGTGATVALGIGFIPSRVTFESASYTWTWTDGMSFGDAKTATVSWTIGPTTGGVLDKLTGSGRASTNVATTSSVIGLLIGTSTVINNPAATYFGYCFR